MTQGHETRDRPPPEGAGRPSIMLILPYFGPWPSYIDLWLRSCRENPDIDWLVLSDRDLPSAPPPNVRQLRTTLAALRDRISDAVGMRVCLPVPYKLCDFRPAYGHVFADELQCYDFWGQCDADLLFGNLRAFLNNDTLNHFDKILIRGNFALYRNTQEVNAYYRLSTPNVDYRTVFADPRSHYFDEWRGICPILRQYRIPFFEEEITADIRSRYFDLRMTRCANYPYQAFAWENGAVNQYYWDGERVRRRSFALIHLQRRRMCPPAADVKEASGWYILPDRFLPKAHDPRGPADLRQLNPRAPWRDLTWQLLRPYRKLRRLARNRALLRNAR